MEIKAGWKQTFKTPKSSANLFQKSPDPKHFLTNLISFFSFLKLVPYHLVWDGESNRFTLKSTFFQQFLCATFHLLSVIPAIGWVQGPLINAFVSHIYQIYFIWLNKYAFLNLINCLHLFFVSVEKGTIFASA